MIDRFTSLRTLVGILASALIATSFVAAAAGPAYAAPVVLAAGTIAGAPTV